MEKVRAKVIVKPEANYIMLGIQTEPLIFFGGIYVPKAQLTELKNLLKSFIKTTKAQRTVDFEIDSFEGDKKHFYIARLHPAKYHIAFHIANAETVLKAIEKFAINEGTFELELPKED
jgi:hypothetical protein